MWRAVKDTSTARRPFVVEHADGRLLRGERQQRGGKTPPPRRWKHALHAQLAADCANRRESAQNPK